MALASDGKIIFLEEPCLGLDKKSKKKLLQLIRDVA
jgi:ABC-type multidrug transport system ATPase subunit